MAVYREKCFTQVSKHQKKFPVFQHEIPKCIPDTINLSLKFVSLCKRILNSKTIIIRIDKAPARYAFTMMVSMHIWKSSHFNNQMINVSF